MNMPTTNRVALLRFELQMSELKQRIGARIRELREERKARDPRWTQDFLARQIDPLLTGAQISRYERGGIKPEDDRLQKIAEILGTDVADLYRGKLADRKPPPTKSPLDVLSGSDEQQEVADDEKLDVLLAGQAQLLAELAQVQVALRELQGSQQRPSRRSAGSRS